MEEHFLADRVEGEPGFVPRPWYNPEGDCIVFKSRNVAVVAERVDGILTLYLSAEDGRPVGFQIKGVRHLLKELGCEGLTIESQARGNEVSVALILWAAYETGPATVSRRRGYAAASESWSYLKHTDSVVELTGV